LYVAEFNIAQGTPLENLCNVAGVISFNVPLYRKTRQLAATEVQPSDKNMKQFTQWTRFIFRWEHIKIADNRLDGTFKYGIKLLRSDGKTVQILKESFENSGL